MSNSGIVARRKGIGSGLAFVVTGPSGAGKNSVIDRVMEELPGLAFSVSYTTRPPREGEVDGVDYIYVSREEFNRLVARGEFVEHMTYLGDMYGTSRSQIEDIFRQGKDVVLNIDVAGARALREIGLDRYTIVYVFLTPSSLERLAERLRLRGSETEEQIAERLRVAESELRAIPAFDYLVINDDYETAVAELSAIIVAERLRITEGSWERRGGRGRRPPGSFFARPLISAPPLIPLL